jgi:hypothetical protein
MDHEALIDAYLGGIEVLRRAVAGMTPEQLRARPVPGRWSTLEVVCHLADFEPIYAECGRGSVDLGRRWPLHDQGVR